MQTFLIYLLQAGMSLCILYGVYCLFLRKETFYRANRYVLLAQLVLSAVAPLIPISLLLPAGGLAGRILPSGEVFSLLLPAVTVGDPGSHWSPGTATGISLLLIILFFYLLVAGVLLIRLLVRIFAALKPALKGTRFPQGDYTLVLPESASEGSYSPFTFFRYIFLHPSQLQKNHIIDHERIHARQLHSVDHLLAELYTVVFWFNPVSWWHKKEILLNLEYLADQGALRQGHERQAYQFDVLQASLGRQPYALANYFAQSIIKKRIKMMNTRQSPPGKSWKYLLMVPAVLMVFVFVQCEHQDDAQQQTEETSAKETAEAPVPRYEVFIDEEDRVHDFASVEKKPRYPGGEKAFMQYVFENFKYPAEAREKGIQGMVLIQFTIKKDGSVTNARVVRGKELGGGLAEEALRVISASQDWTPGEHNGKAVAVSYTIPINARLSTPEEKQSSGKTVGKQQPWAYLINSLQVLPEEC